jgi:hypothetical protein
MTREEDSVLAEFLEFLDRAMQADPSQLRPFTASDIEGLSELLAGVEVEPDEDLGDFTLP